LGVAQRHSQNCEMANRCLSRHRISDGEPVTTRRVRLLLRATKSEPGTSLYETSKCFFLSLQFVADAETC
jgi:hypothetical protein